MQMDGGSPSEQGFSAADVSKALAMKFRGGPEGVSQEALLDQYVRNFQALQSVAQAIPQPKQAPCAQTALSKDRIEDFARAFSQEPRKAPSAFRPVPTRGACMLFSDPPVASGAPPGNERASTSRGKNQLVLVPSIAELDQALELSLDPSPKLSLLAAKLQADETALREGRQARVDRRDSIECHPEYARAFKDHIGLSFNGRQMNVLPRMDQDVVSPLRPSAGFLRLGGQESLRAHQWGGGVQEPPASKLSGIFQDGEGPLGLKRASTREKGCPELARTVSTPKREEQGLESAEKMTSKWCGTLFTEAWSSGPKRKREESGLDAAELLKLFEWMEEAADATGGRSVRSLDGVLELLEEMLGFRRRGGEANSMQRQVQNKRPATALPGTTTRGLFGLEGLEERVDSIRTVPLGRGWEEECIRGVLEQIVRQGAARRRKVIMDGVE